MSSAPVFFSIEPLLEHISATGPPGVVLADGCFDPLHVGHIRYLRGAAARGDFLVVALHSDESTRRLKGEGRPVVTARDRADVLAALEMVDAVLVFEEDDVTGVLGALGPAVHIKRVPEDGA